MAQVSVVIPTFNRLELLKTTLSSVQGQTLRDIQIVVVDDGSSDGTVDWLAAESARDPRLIPLTRGQLPKGSNVCRNLGLEICSAPWVLFLDSDDLLAPQALESRLSHVQAASNCDLGVFPGRPFYENITDRLELLCFPEASTIHPLVRHFLGQHWPTGCALWRRDFLARLAGWNENMPAMQDWELNVRALVAGANTEFFPGACDYFMRCHQGHRITNDWISVFPSLLAGSIRTISLLSDQQKEMVARDASLAWPFLRIVHASFDQNRPWLAWRAFCAAKQYNHQIHFGFFFKSLVRYYLGF